MTFSRAPGCLHSFCLIQAETADTPSSAKGQQFTLPCDAIPKNLRAQTLHFRTVFLNLAELCGVILHASNKGPFVYVLIFLILPVVFPSILVPRSHWLWLLLTYVDIEPSRSLVWGGDNQFGKWAPNRFRSKNFEKTKLKKRQLLELLKCWGHYRGSNSSTDLLGPMYWWTKTGVAAGEASLPTGCLTFAKYSHLLVEPRKCQDIATCVSIHLRVCRSLKTYVINPYIILQREGIILLWSHDENCWNQKTIYQQATKSQRAGEAAGGECCNPPHAPFHLFPETVQTLSIICDLVMCSYLLEIEYFMSYN